jgi:hypothetical protein
VILKNKGAVGSTICGPYQDENGLGYLGGDTRGIGLFSSINVEVTDVEIEDNKTTTRVIGIDMKNAQAVEVKNTEIEDFSSTATASEDMFPNLTPHACGTTCDANSQATIGDNVKTEDLNALDVCPNELVPTN